MSIHSYPSPITQSHKLSHISFHYIHPPIYKTCTLQGLVLDLILNQGEEAIVAETAEGAGAETEMESEQEAEVEPEEN